MQFHVDQVDFLVFVGGQFVARNSCLSFFGPEGRVKEESSTSIYIQTMPMKRNRASLWTSFFLRCSAMLTLGFLVETLYMSPWQLFVS